MIEKLKQIRSARINMKKKKKLVKLPVLARKAWKLMSLYSRQKDLMLNELGFVACVTCGKIEHWKDMHAGHWFHASKQSAVTYDHRNIHVQCVMCNTYKGGARDDYAVYIKNRYGAHVLDELQTLKHQGHILRRQELEDKIVELQGLLSELNKWSL